MRSRSPWTIKKILKLLGRGLVRGAGRFREPTYIGVDHIFGLDRVYGICSSSVLAVRRETEMSNSRISLGSGVWIGENVEIESADPGAIEIGENTSIQHGCVIRGDVKIGAHCIFARNVL